MSSGRMKIEWVCPEDEELVAIKELYLDPYGTLMQSILIDCELDAQSNGLHSKIEREKINPNLHLVKREFITRRKQDEPKI
jgi:hypothetical protein